MTTLNHTFLSLNYFEIVFMQALFGPEKAVLVGARQLERARIGLMPNVTKCEPGILLPFQPCLIFMKFPGRKLSPNLC